MQAAEAKWCNFLNKNLYKKNVLALPIIHAFEALSGPLVIAKNPWHRFINSVLICSKKLYVHE